MADVIDSLVVTLGLDSKSFAEGVNGASEKLAGFTKRLAGMFIAVKSIEGVVDYFKDLHEQLAAIGFESKNLGITGTELKKLGEVSELFGGQASDAAASVEQLQNSVFNLRFKGQVSENLVMLQRFGVAFVDAAGHAREFEDVARDAAAAIDKQAKVAGLNGAERQQLALSFGFTGGIASAVAQGGKGLEKALADAKIDQKALTQKTIDGQVNLSRDLTRQHEALQAVNSTLLAKLTPTIEALNKWMADLVKNTIPLLIKAIDSIIDFFKNPPPWLALIQDALGDLAQTLGGAGTLLAALGTLTLAIVSLPAAIVLALGVLLGELITKLFPSGGALDHLSEWISRKFGGDEYDPNAKGTGGAGPHGTAAGTINRHPAPPTPTAPRPASAAAQSAAAGSAGAAHAGNSTQVHIDEINVVTRATDANAMAGDVDGALRRKLLVSNADAGTQ